MTDFSQEQQSGNLFVVSAPSGAGKTSLVRALLEQLPEIDVAVSHTTRPQRPDESGGVNYHFIDEAAFRAMVEKEEFLEWATVFEHLYGTSVGAANLVMAKGKHLILEIDWQGAAQIRRRIPATQSIFIFPPSLKSLRDRLENRAQDDEATVDKRMNAAFEELIHYDEFDYLIVNDDFDTALNELIQIVGAHGDQFSKDKRLPALAPLIRELLPQKAP